MSVLTYPDNRGTEFVVGFLQNHGDSETKLELLLINPSSEPAIVTITAPGANYSEQFIVTDTAVQVVTLPHSIMLRGHERAQKGVLVTADREIILYGANKQSGSTDGFLGLPVDVLGREYFVASYTSAFQYNPSEFAIFGVESDTLISVTLKGTVYHDNKYHYSGSVITFSLDRLEAMQFQGEYQSDLTGTHIVSDKPVSVMSGVRCTNVPNQYRACDHLVEHIPPVNTWGRRFVTVALAGRRAGDIFRLVAARNGTTVNVTGISPRTLDAGEFWELDFSSSTYKSITSSQPIMVLQYSKGLESDGITGDPFMMYLPSVEQFAADYTFPTVDAGYSTSYVNIVIKTSETSGLTYDGNPLPSNTTWAPIPDSDLSATQLHIDTKGTHKVKHESANVIFSLTYYDFSSYDSVGFPLGLRLANIPGGCEIPRDDDSDGLIDEDLADTAAETTTLSLNTTKEPTDLLSNTTTEPTTSFNTTADLTTAVFNTTTTTVTTTEPTTTTVTTTEPTTTTVTTTEPTTVTTTEPTTTTVKPTEPTTTTLPINITTTQLSTSPDESGTMATTAA
ncbi:PREDICTED: IgGFc-binding protein-like [Branchiostoma belcheri]|uniref:IgGFc-binding protein-like n=1 Tax=Branchiostoma belcheri TaxID=7741 RepID=A0A6P4Z9J4_BRABE|nr:PREDICTED: IgGFc-binding protein-like [Branchiostoma belcheri]